MTGDLPVFPADLLAEFLERGETEGPAARLEALPAGQFAGHDAPGCDAPRCRERARYLSALRYTVGGQVHQRGRLVCDSHAARFAARHGIDFTAVRPPEGESR